MEMTLQVLLAQLGQTPEEVAAALQAQGIQGVRNTVRFLNPIVRYLQRELRLDAWGLDLIQGDRVRLLLGDGTQREATLPPPVRLFLTAFDQGAYPQLLLPA